MRFLLLQCEGGRTGHCGSIASEGGQAPDGLPGPFSALQCVPRDTLSQSAL